MDNEIAPSDTLYLNNWWAKLDVYNYEEAILLQDFCERWDETSNVFGEVESLDYYPPYPDIPRFRMTDYLWGKKDLFTSLLLSTLRTIAFPVIQHFPGVKLTVPHDEPLQVMTTCGYS